MQKMPTATIKTEMAALVLAFCLLATVALRPSIRGNDGVGHYVFLASLVRGGDLDFRDEYAAYDALKQYPYKFADLPLDPHTGRPTDRYGVGAALLWSPFVMVTHAVLRLLRPELATGLSRPYEWAVGFATAFWGSLGLGLIYGRLRREWGRWAAAATVAGLIFATPLGFYLYAHGSMSHGVSFFAATVALLALERAWRNPSAFSVACCGGAAALMVMIRFQDATWALVLGAALAWRLLAPQPNESANQREQLADASPTGARPHSRTQTLLALALAALAALVTFLPQMAAWKVLYGSWLSGPAPYMNDSAGNFSPWPRHLPGVLFSQHGGVLALHPLFALALAGLVMILFQKGKNNPALRRLAALALAGFALQLLLIACWSAWDGAASFGNRYFISALPFLAPGVAYWLDRRRPRAGRIAAVGALLILSAWNTGLLIQYATEMMPREAAIPWSRVIRQNLIDVPHLLLRKFK